ncbi:MAG TPA: matrixin family metalloprotease [Myxococcales bacterium]|nr:matrixin family metalloprotease [Myxococcales bacterium]
MIWALASVAGAYQLKRDSTGEPVCWQGAAELVMDPASTGALGDPAALQAARAAVAEFVRANGAIDLRLREGKTRGVGYNPVGDNSSEIVVVDHDWPYDAAAIAVTVVTVDTRRHRILDADIAFNAASRRFKVLAEDSRPGGDFDDLQNTLTHELGHALGLAHNPDDQTATMFPAARRGEVHKRTLADDDVQGLQALYPPDSAAQDVPEAQVGCGAAPGSLAPALAALLALLALRRKGRSLHATALAALALCAFPAAARAGEARFASAALVQTAQVVRSVTRVEDGLFITRLELRTRACARGACPGTLEVERLGGRIGPLEQWVDGELPPEVGAVVGVTADALPGRGAALRPRQASLYRMADPREWATFTRGLREAGLRLPRP